MPERIKIAQYLPEILKGIAALLTGAATFWGAIAAYVGWKKKKLASESKHAESFRKDAARKAKVDKIINTMHAAIPHTSIISTSRWKNGEEPKVFRIESSTDFNTWALWKNWQVPEDDLVRIQAATLDESVCLFRPSQLQDPVTRDWHEGNDIKQTTSFLIAVDDLRNESLVLYINYNKEHIVTAETRKLIRLYVGQLYELYEPSGWLAKKNYLKN